MERTQRTCALAYKSQWRRFSTERRQRTNRGNNWKIMALCETIGDLASEWEETVKVTGRERFPGHLRGIAHDLGCSIPDEPNARALWVAALINPLPALGVALEIRPAVLTARTTSRRLRIAKQGLRDSIDRMRRPGSCFWIRWPRILGKKSVFLPKKLLCFGTKSHERRSQKVDV